MKNILRSRLETMLENSRKIATTEKRNVNTNKVMWPPVSEEELEILVQYIGEFYRKGTKTMWVWRKFLADFDKAHDIDWEGRRNIYRNTHNLEENKIVPKVEIIRSNRDIAKCVSDYAILVMEKLFPEAMEYLIQAKER